MRNRIPSRLLIRQILAAHLHAAALAIVLSSSILPAQFQVKQVNLEYLARRADIILQGRVIQVVQEPLPGYPNISTTKVTLDVENMIRGPAGNTYTFREVFLGLPSKEGKKSYRVGQQLFLFLPSPSQYGLSSPVGIEQGRFHIARAPGGGMTVVNESGNEGLFRGIQQSASRAGRRLTTSQLRVATTKRGPVQLDGFVSLVKSFTSLPRIQ